MSQVTENSKTGWRFSTANPSNYGNIGTEATDLSVQLSSSTTKGAGGNYAVAMGYGATASGNQSTAMGQLTTASGSNSTAMGEGAIASGQTSTAMGRTTTASGSYSIAMGQNTISSGNNSTTIGIATTASDYGSLVVGTYNSVGSSVTSGGAADNFDADNSAFVIGNGTPSGSRSDAFVVYASGNTTLAGDMTVTGNDITFGNGETISNSTDGTLAITAPATTMSGTLTSTGALTASANLTIGNGASTAGSIVFNEDTDDGSNTLTLKPAAMAANVTLTLPVDDGTANQVLATDGDGALSWATAGGTTLSRLTENSKTGWRFSTATAANYGDIGTEAVDMSFSASSSTTKGATGDYSTAMGYGTTASGSYSIAMGQNTISSGNNSTAMGYGTTASGSYSTAMGANTIASGNRSTAMGESTTASGTKSTAMGESTIASDYGSLVLGKYNSVGSSVTSGGSATAFDADNSAFVIGNGTASGSESDAFVVYSSGNATLAGALTVGTTIGHTADADLMTLANGSVTFTGSTVIATADVNGGAIDGAAIGANSASTGAFTTVTASTSLDVTGSAGVILQNDETITNSTDGTVAITATTTALSGDLTVTGNDLTFGNGETISNSTDGTVVVTATTIEMAGKTDFADNAITGYGADLQTLSGTSKTLAASDNGTVIVCSSGSATTITVPTGLPAGFNCMIVQTGSGQVTFNASSTTLNNRNGLKTAAQYAMMTLVNYSSNTFVVSGDTVN